MTSRREKELRDDFLFWWPVVARLGGLIGAFAFGGYAALTHSAPDAGLLAFFGTLILVPTIFKEQDRRNRKSRDAEDDEA